MRTIVSAAAVFLAVLMTAPGTLSQGGVTSAPTGFETGNGFIPEFCANQDQLTSSPNSPEIPADECNLVAAEEEFTGPEEEDEGLGPIFNAAGCGECHLVPALGGGSQIMEKRAGLFQNGVFNEHPGGSLIQDRALLEHTRQELALPAHTNVVTFRATIPLFGIGFVEAIGNSTLDGIRNNQPFAQRGQIIDVPVLEKPGQNRHGRFGWKSQHASLVSFSADAYKNEMGITSPLEPVENTSNGNPVDDPVPGVDDQGIDVELFALFMRDLKAPPRGPIDDPDDVSAGESLFTSVGCAVCHTKEIVTSPPGTSINGGALKVTGALGNKRIRPFSDFLLHDIGTGDGIVQNGGSSTRNKVRTPALWGLHTRGRFMHDASSFNLTDAINRHGNQASAARNAFNALGSTSRNKLIAFLLSL